MQPSDSLSVEVKHTYIYMRYSCEKVLHYLPITTALKLLSITDTFPLYTSSSFVVQVILLPVRTARPNGGESLLISFIATAIFPHKLVTHAQ